MTFFSLPLQCRHTSIAYIDNGWIFLVLFSFICFLIPVVSFCLIFWNAPTISIAISQITLRCSITLPCRFSIPFHGFLIILSYSIPHFIAIA